MGRFEIAFSNQCWRANNHLPILWASDWPGKWYIFVILGSDVFALTVFWTSCESWTIPALEAIDSILPFQKRKISRVSRMCINTNPLENFKMWVCHESPVTEQLPWNRMRGESIAQQSWQIKYPQRKRYNQWNYFCICAGFGGGRCVCFVKQMTKGTSAEQKMDFNR